MENNKEINELLDQLQDLSMLKKDVDQEIKNLESRVKRYMEEKHVDTLFGINDQKATYREVISNRFNTTAFKKEYAKLYAEFQRPIRSFKFSFTY